MAQGLQLLANELVAHPDLTSPDSQYKDYYATVNHNTELYINYIVGYESLLFTKQDLRKNASAFDVYKRYGWILAGNYYTVLSAFKEKADLLTRHFYPATALKFVGNNLPDPKPGDAYDASQDFFVNFQSTTTSPPTPGGKYDVQGYQEAIVKSTKARGGSRVIGIVNMDNIFAALGKPTDMSKNAGKNGAATVATRSAVENFLSYLTGEGSNPNDLRVAKDPILRIANYGKSLQISAMIILPIVTALYLLSAVVQVCDGLLPIGAVAETIMKVTAAPLFGLFLFMYTQGAILGVFIPLIPYLSFFIGVVGWLLQVIEAVAAAPLVAVGLVFPGTKDDVWGQAEPAKMMILALFLRPSLMIIGLAAAMMVMWVLTELLNIGFLMLTAVTFRTEDAFGFVTIMMAYTTIFIVVVTRSYSLINVVPNKVLSWIGGHGMDVEGAGEAISAAKGGVTEGAGAVTGGLKAGQDLAEKGVGAAKEIGKIKQGGGTAGGGTPTPPAP
jgi:conjugal transfer/type IV secretion protein DotA/TraY